MTNNKLSPVTVYVPVGSEGGLPTDCNDKFVILSNGLGVAQHLVENEWEGYDLKNKGRITHWLKEQERFIFTKDELESFLKDFFRNAQQLKQYPDFANYKYRNPEDLIQSLF